MALGQPRRIHVARSERTPQQDPHHKPPNITPIPTDLFGFMWIYVDLYGFMWIYVDLCGFMWIYMDLFGFI